MSKYTDLLKSPEWQKKRLKILERDNWTCHFCHDQEETLVVHHRYYTKGALPWEYPDKCYITLCSTCHARLHKDEKEVIADIVNKLKRSGIDLVEFCDLARSFEQCLIKEDSGRLLLTLQHVLLNEKAQMVAIQMYEDTDIETKVKYALIPQS